MPYPLLPSVGAVKQALDGFESAYRAAKDASDHPDETTLGEAERLHQRALKAREAFAAAVSPLLNVGFNPTPSAEALAKLPPKAPSVAKAK